MNAFPSVPSGAANQFPTRFDGMIVYNTNEGGTAGVGSTDGTLTPGYWYYENKSGSVDGGTWKPLGSGNPKTPELSGSASIILDGDSLVRAELSGDVSAAVNSNFITINNGAVGSDKIASGAVGRDQLSSMSAVSGQVLSYDGMQWSPTTLETSTITGSIKIMMCQGYQGCSIDPGSDWSCTPVFEKNTTAGTTGWGTGKTCMGVGGAAALCGFVCVR
jgi:hypothetical protein